MTTQNESLGYLEKNSCLSDPTRSGKENCPFKCFVFKVTSAGIEGKPSELLGRKFLSSPPRVKAMENIEDFCFIKKILQQQTSNIDIL
jgi:hypothetical protein